MSGDDGVCGDCAGAGADTVAVGGVVREKLRPRGADSTARTWGVTLVTGLIGSPWR